jgi:hypothetical protein
MSSTGFDLLATRPAPAAARSIPAAARTVLAMLSHLKRGAIDVHLPDGSARRLGEGAMRAAMHVSDWKVFSRTLAGGDVGFAEGYIAGEWDSPDLTALLTLLVADRDALERVVYGSWWGSLLYRARHALNRNSRRGSWKRRSRPSCGVHSAKPGWRRARACSRSAAAGAAWPRWRRATSARM